MKKRLIAIALAVCTLLLFAASVSAAGTGNGAAAAVLADNTDPAETPEITRAAWIQSLVSAFSLTVENDNYPDNYFSDLTSDKPYYHDILTAVDFGVVDTPLGEAFRPEEAATREFAAHTLNYCLGYQMDEETGYTFSEAQSITYPEDLQVAVTRGWFQLSGKNALPEQAITAAEKSAMLADAEAALKGEVINENYQNSYSFAEGVVVIPEGTEVTASDTTLTVQNCPVTIVVGDVIAVYQNGIPVVYLTNAVTEQDGALVLTVTHLEETDAYTGIDAQGTVEASLEDVIPLEDSQLGYYVPETDTTYDSYEAALYAVEHMERTQATASTDASTRKIELVCKRTLTFDGASVDISLKFKNVYVDYKISLKEQRAYVKLSYDAEFSYGIKYDAAKAVNADDVDLLFWGVPGVGGVTISLETELSGSAKGIHKFHGACGVEYTKADGVRVPCNIDAKTMAVSAEGTAKLGLKVKFGVTKLPVVKAYLYASAGATGKLSVKTYNDNALPEKCTHFAVYLYAKYGATGSVKILNDKRTLSFDTIIYNEKNSPIRIVRHYEDGTLTASCTRDGAGIPSDGLGGGGSWFTPGGSIYAGSGWSGGSTQQSEYSYRLDESDDETYATITKYNGNASALIVPDTLGGYPVKKIGNRAFYGNTKIQSVILPDSIDTIESDAFSGCTNLGSIQLPNSLTALGCNAFRNCSSLTYIKLPKTLKSVITNNVTGVFSGCTALQTVELEEGMTAIPVCLFQECPLSAITIPNTVTSIELHAFAKSGLVSIEIPDSVTTIGHGAFSDCAMLTSVMLPDSVTEIDTSAFDGCTKLNDVKMSNSLTALGSNAFRNCSSLTYIWLPKTLKSVLGNNNAGVFPGCTALQTVELEEGMTAIPVCLFQECPLSTITIPNTVTSIELLAFAKSELVSIVIPDSVTEINRSAFDGCTKLSDVKMSNRLTVFGFDAFRNCSSLTYIKLPKTLKSVDGNNVYGVFSGCTALQTVELEEGMTTIPSCLFRECPLSAITIPNTVTSIEIRAFADSGLVSVEIPNLVTTIGHGAFSGCKLLTSVRIPDSVTKIDSYAFDGCTSLEEIAIPDSTSSIDYGIFNGCSALKSVKLSNSCQNIAANMFLDCTSLESIVLPDSVTNIQSSAFSGCTALKELVWSKSLTTIGDSAFRSTALTELRLPDTLTRIGNSAFRDCGALNTVVLPNGVTRIDSSAFKNCDALTAVVVPDSVSSLGSSVFYDCDALTNVTLGVGITAIPSAAFEHCDLLEEITIPRRVTSIGDTAFKNCVKFRAVHIPRSVTSISSTAFSYLSKLTIYGVPGTYAETFANANSITFVSEEIHAESLVLDPKELTLLKGASAQLSLSILPVGCTDVVSWKSSDTAVVTVSDTGLVKAVGTGTATIKVVAGSQSASCKVTVGQPVTSISLNKTSLTLEALDSYQLTATVNPSNAANRSVTWASSDGSVASVTQDGLVTALKKGTAVITVSAQDGSGVQKTCTVTVSNTAYICPTPDELESPHNYPDSCSDIWIYTKPGAESLQVTFDARTNMEDGFDYLYIYDASGNQVGKYTGTVLAGQTITVPGDTVRIKLVSDSSGNAWGFKVSRVQSAGDGMPGDLDGDGELTSADVVLLARYLAGAETLTEAQLTAADLNADGVITSADLVLLARKVAGLE